MIIRNLLVQVGVTRYIFYCKSGRLLVAAIDSHILNKIPINSLWIIHNPVIVDCSKTPGLLQKKILPN